MLLFRLRCSFYGPVYVTTTHQEEINLIWFFDPSIVCGHKVNTSSITTRMKVRERSINHFHCSHPNDLFETLLSFFVCFLIAEAGGQRLTQFVWMAQENCLNCELHLFTCLAATDPASTPAPGELAQSLMRGIWTIFVLLIIFRLSRGLAELVFVLLKPLVLKAIKIYNNKKIEQKLFATLSLPPPLPHIKMLQHDDSFNASLLLHLVNPFWWDSS